MSLTTDDLKQIEDLIDWKLEDKLKHFVTKEYFDEKFGQLADMIMSLKADNDYEREFWHHRITENSQRITKLESAKA